MVDFTTRVMRRMMELNLTQKELALDAGVSISTVSRLLSNNKISRASQMKIESSLWKEEVKSFGRRADLDKGGYFYETHSHMVGNYFLVRPLFDQQNRYEIYQIVISWDADRECLVFTEKKPDKFNKQTNGGIVYIPPLTPCFYLLGITLGSVRLITFSAVQKRDGIFSGLLSTLALQDHSHVAPASSHVVMKRSQNIDQFDPKIVDEENDCIKELVDLFPKEQRNLVLT